MQSHCLKCNKKTENINPRALKTSSGKAMVLSNCAICGSKKSRFIKEQEACGLFSCLGIKTPLTKIPFWVIFCSNYFEWNFSDAILLNAISLMQFH